MTKKPITTITNDHAKAIAKRSQIDREFSNHIGQILEKIAGPSATQHTPGPWGIKPPALAGGSNAVYARECLIAQVIREDYNKNVTATDDANARLIAAAPDLLAACIAMLVEFDDGRVTDSIPAVLRAQTAVAKATGNPALTASSPALDSAHGRKENGV